MNRRTLTLMLMITGLALALAAPAWAAPSPGFYDTVPANLARLSNGAVIRSEAETDFLPTLSHQAAAYRIAYRSTGQLGGPVMVSGMVFVPKGTAPKGGWAIVAWGHGTSGVGDLCNPSRWPDLYDGYTWDVYLDQIDDLLADGYVVSATDYEGLGTPGLHTYCLSDGLGRATIDGVRAAHARVATSSTRWAAIGHSEGGQAAVAAGELAANYGRGLTYVGGVAYAPAHHLKELIPLEATLKFEAPYIAYEAVGMRSIDPTFDYARMVGPLYSSRMSLAEVDNYDQWFLTENRNITPTYETALNPAWASDPTVQRFYALTQTGLRREAAPLLILQGTADDLYTYYPQYLRGIIATGTTVHGITYNSVTHDAVMRAGWPDAEQWLKDRFAGRPAPKDVAP